MSNTTTPATKSLGGYAVTSVKQHEGRDGVAFSAVITKDGKKVIRVRNEGCGGCNFYDYVGSAPTGAALEKVMPKFRADLAEFEAFAATWNAGNEFAGIEDADQLVTHLIEVATLNRLRKTPFLLDDVDFFGTGEYLAVRGAATREQVVEMLRQPAYAGRNPRVWDKTRSEFVPVA